MVFCDGNVLVLFLIPQGSQTRIGRAVNYIRAYLAGDWPAGQCRSPYTFQVNFSGPYLNFNRNGYPQIRACYSGLVDSLWKEIVKIKNDVNVHCGAEIDYRQETNVLTSIFRPNLQNTGSFERKKKRTYASYCF